MSVEQLICNKIHAPAFIKSRLAAGFPCEQQQLFVLAVYGVDLVPPQRKYDAFLWLISHPSQHYKLFMYLFPAIATMAPAISRILALTTVSSRG